MDWIKELLTRAKFHGTGRTYPIGQRHKHSMRENKAKAEIVEANINWSFHR